MSANKQNQKKEEDIKTQKRNKKRYWKILIIIILVILIILGLLKLINFYKEKNNNTENVQNAQQESNDKLSGIQAQIDEQQKVIDKINEELVPLVEQRTELENEMLKITEKDETQTNTTQE